MLEVGLIGLGPSTQKQLGREPLLLRHVRRVVVVHLVVVPGHDEREPGVRRLQVRVGPVQRVAVAVVTEQFDLVAGVLPRPAVTALILVDVVTQVKDQIEVVLEHVPVGGEEPGLVVLAGHERHPQLVDRRTGRRERPGATDAARLATRAEAVPVPAVRLESLHLDMDRMPERRGRHGGAALHDVGHPLIPGDLPAHLHRLVRHAAAFERYRSQTGPEHRTVGRRVAGGDPQAEGRTGELRRLTGLSDQRYRRRREQRHPTRHEGATGQTMPEPLIATRVTSHLAPRLRSY